MDQFIEGKNPYVILELENGQKRSFEEIKKAYRRLALVKHPDKAKNTNAVQAAQEFDELKKAYAILSDKSARGALDDYLEAQAHREARLAQQDAKRQKLRQELERKEREGEKTRSEEEVARARLKVELEALRARAQQEQRDRQQQQQAAAAARAASSAGAGTSGRAPAAAAAEDEDETTQLLMRTVKVTWDPTAGSYSTDRLRDLFGKKFIVEDVIHKESRKKSKASALVVLSSIQAAGQAAHEVLGDLKNPLLITPYLKVMPEAQQQQQQQQQQDRQPPGSGTAAAGAADGGRRPPGGAPLFAVGGGAAAAAAGGGSKPVQRPSKPLFPGGQAAASPAPAAPAAAAAAAAGAEGGTASDAAAGDAAANGAPGSSKPKTFSSFPGMPAAAAGSKGFSSFPGMPSGGYESSVLQKLQQKSQNKQQ